MLTLAELTKLDLEEADDHFRNKQMKSVYFLTFERRVQSKIKFVQGWGGGNTENKKTVMEVE